MCSIAWTGTGAPAGARTSTTTLQPGAPGTTTAPSAGPVAASPADRSGTADPPGTRTPRSDLELDPLTHEPDPFVDRLSFRIAGDDHSFRQLLGALKKSSTRSGEGLSVAAEKYVACFL